jgi:hypothetical protein
MVPKAKRDAVWQHYQPGQEQGKATPSEAWHKAADAAIDAVARLEKFVVRTAKTPAPTSATNATGTRTTKRPLHALTLHRPWPWAICYLNKRVENRGWKPPAHAIGQWIGIHAGSTFDARAANAIYEEISISIPTEAKGHHTGIVALAKVTGYTESEDSLPTAQQRWWSGPFGWVLSEVVVFESPVVVAGQQGLWKVQGSVLERCREQFSHAKLLLENARVLASIEGQE